MIPGIGAYTAGAIASIAYGEKAALVDGNVVRVLARIFALEDDMRARAGQDRVWKIAETLVQGVDGVDAPRARAHAGAGDWNQALMELGATICTPRSPRCDACPAREICRARARDLVLELPRMTKKTKPIPMHRLALVATTSSSSSSSSSRRRDSVLLARRREGGTFAGMWEPPSIDVVAAKGNTTLAPREAERRFAAVLGTRTRARLSDVSPSGRITHVLSHRRMIVDVFRGAVSAPASFARAIAAGDYDRVELVALSEVARAGAQGGARGITTFARKILRAGGA